MGLEFNFEDFNEEDLSRLNSEKNLDGYGRIYLTTERDKYIIDVTYETKEAYDRDGICLEVYIMGDDYTHKDWIETVRSITVATNYKRFVTRAKEEILKAVMFWEENS